MHCSLHRLRLRVMEGVLTPPFDSFFKSLDKTTKAKYISFYTNLISK